MLARSAVFALALAPSLAVAQDYPPCPDMTGMRLEACSTLCRYSPDVLMAMPSKCSVITGSSVTGATGTLDNKVYSSHAKPDYRALARQMLDQCPHGMTVEQCLGYLSSERSVDR